MKVSFLDMPDDKTYKAHLVGGKKSKYDEKKHIELLFDVFKNGESVAAFCAIAMINRHTFYEWVKKYSKFNDAYEIVKNISERWWLERPMVMGDNFNFPYWFINMKNRFGYTDHRKVRLTSLDENAPLSKQHEEVVKEMKQGNITPQESNYVTNTIASKIKIEEHEIMRKDIKEIKAHLGIG